MFWEILTQIGNIGKRIEIQFSRADAARQKSEALRSLATQLIEEHDDYTKKNEKVHIIIYIINISTNMILFRWRNIGWRSETVMCISGKRSWRKKLRL